MQIGDMRIDALIDGEAALDKEGLYGGVNPPTEEDWAPYARYLDPCTGQQINTIGSYLIRYRDKVVLHDTGMGLDALPPFNGGGLRSALWALDVSPLDITDVVYSHLHIDHIGWTSQAGKAYFPNAAIRIDRRDWEHYSPTGYQLEEWEVAVTKADRDLVSVRFAPVAHRIELFEAGDEILPGIVALEAAGHTPGHTVFELTSRGEQGLLLGDLVHTQGELVEAWDLAFNQDHGKAIEAIERYRRRLYDTGLPFAAAHFPGLKWGRLVKDGATPSGIAYETVR
ncbi:MBL fold metallo-hydrolase [Amycolatopsis jejuensis]|uniref:MBL fold metallo-hydrolase n=1 Tax=Amycolatopsis jejuensis TaxID=330084 RepID=UPI000527EF76|nr:MBL fold metallo-hydrolase [Amycolatopsis jejuensis]